MRLPEPSLATHSDATVHDTAVMFWAGSMSAACHVVAPPVGSVEVTTLPAVSTATQSAESDVHDTPFSFVPVSIAVTVQPPAVGVEDSIALPTPSTATQRSAVHEMPVIVLVPSTPATSVHEPVGSVVVNRFPWLSPATHRFALVHEIAVSELPLSIVVGSGVHTSGVVEL